MKTDPMSVKITCVFHYKRTCTVHLANLSLFPCSGDAVWLPGEELAQSPWDLIRKRLSQRITIHLKGELAVVSFRPISHIIHKQSFCHPNVLQFS